MVPENTVWKVRPYGEAVGDYQMVSGWRKAHDSPPMPETLVPPLAIISELDGEPMAFAACYQSYGVGVCFMDWFTSRPGLSLKMANEAIGHVIGAMKECTKATHGLAIGYGSPVIARATKRWGFKVMSKDCWQMASLIN